MPVRNEGYHSARIVAEAAIRGARTAAAVNAEREGLAAVAAALLVVAAAIHEVAGEVGAQ